jgi:hypothetical protein
MNTSLKTRPYYILLAVWVAATSILLWTSPASTQEVPVEPSVSEAQPTGVPCPFIPGGDIFCDENWAQIVASEVQPFLNGDSPGPGVGEPVPCPFIPSGDIFCSADWAQIIAEAVRPFFNGTGPEPSSGDSIPCPFIPGGDIFCGPNWAQIIAEAIRPHLDSSSQAGGGGSSPGSGGGGGGGAAPEITQDGVQESEVGEIEQTTKVS